MTQNPLNQKPEQSPFKVTVFCSANDNIDPRFFRAAGLFSAGLASRGWELVYGGANVGLMGHFANEAIRNGAKVRGAITAELAKGFEVAHKGITELVITQDLLERKRWLMDAGDAFAIFPGGLGTLDEALEAITTKGLGSHKKPIVFVDLDGFWQSQIKVFQEFAMQGMIRAEGGLRLYEVCETVEETLAVFDGAAQRQVSP